MPRLSEPELDEALLPTAAAEPELQPQPEPEPEPETLAGAPRLRSSSAGGAASGPEDIDSDSDEASDRQLAPLSPPAGRGTAHLAHSIAVAADDERQLCTRQFGSLVRGAAMVTLCLIDFCHVAAAILNLVA